MRSLVLLFIAVCARVSFGASLAYADASPDPMPPCRKEDVGKPCPKTPFGPPSRCAEQRCDDGSDPRVVGDMPMCYVCAYDAVADRPNIERRERARAVERAASRREEQQLAELQQRKKRNLIALGIGMSLLAAAYFVIYRFRARKS